MQAKELQEKHGLNRLTPPKEQPEIIKFLLQFTNPLMALLLVAGSLTFMAYALQVRHVCSACMHHMHSCSCLDS
jgi:magnesium-transporting ATPase (P-type)